MELIGILHYILGDNHRVIASMYNVLASVCLESGRSSEASLYYNESRKITEIIESEPISINEIESEFEQKIFTVFGSNVEVFPPAAAAHNKLLNQRFSILNFCVCVIYKLR